MSSPQPAPTVLCVHGAWHGPWAWDRLRRNLTGIDTQAVDLPSSGADPAQLGDLAADAEVLRAAVSAIDGPVVVLAHSYGGAVATEALADLANVQRIIYLTAFVPDEHESVDRLIGHKLYDWITADAEGSYTEIRDPADVFYNDCTPHQARTAAEQLTPQSVPSLHGEITKPAWRHRPSTYVLCTKDHALNPGAQAVFSARCNEMRRIRADHSPMLSQPDALADLLRSVIACEPTT